MDDATPSRRCSKCGEVKPLDAFYRDPRWKSGLRSECKACSIAQAKVRSEKNRERRSEQQRARRLRDPERYLRMRRRYHLKRTYGLTEEQYDAMLAAQGSICAMCGEPLRADRRGYYFPVDHDHQTGAPRAILCNRCNISLGYIEDPVLMANAAAYLAKFERGGGPDQ